MNKLDRLVAIILAAIIGCAAVALALLIIAKGLGIGGAGIIYLIVLVVNAGVSYGFCVKLVKRFTWIRWPVIVLLVLGIAYLSIGYQSIGFEDPIVPIIIVIAPIAFLYMVLPDTSKSAANQAGTTANFDRNIEELKLRGNVDGLVAIQNNGADWMRSLDAAEALAQMGDQRGMDYLSKAAENPDSDIKNVAAEILEGLKDYKPLPPIISTPVAGSRPESSFNGTCFLCDKPIKGNELGMPSRDHPPVGFSCNNCGSLFCLDHQKELKFSIWNGYHSPCPKCGESLLTKKYTSIVK